MNQNVYYASSAYDSTKLYAGFPNRSDELGFSKRRLLKHPLPNINSSFSGELFGIADSIDILAQLQANKTEIQEQLNAPFHETLAWSNLRNPKAALRLFSKLVLIFSVCTTVGGGMMAIVALFANLNFALYFKAMAIFFSPAAVFYILHRFSQQLIKSGKIINKNDIIFNRRTGMVTIPWRKEEKELAFADFGPYLDATVNPSGSQDFNLLLYHRGNHEIINEPGGVEQRWMVCLDWEFLHQYMDISQPLPDVPAMEPFREKDPVTAEYDKKHNRPPRYWRDMDIDKARQMHEASFKAASTYPWGLTREQAIASGWQPSGFGEGDWRER